MLTAVAAAARSERGWLPGDLGFISAAACGSPAFDRMEALALRTLLADSAREVPVAALKGYCGNLSGSAVLRAVMGVLSLDDDLIPPTARLRTPDDDLGLRVTTGREPLAPGAGRILQVGAGPGGGYAAFTLSRP